MAQLVLSFLGSWQVSVDGQLLTGFESGKVRALLTYLAVESDRPHYRTTLAGLLWPEMPETGALSNLRQALANLRKVIGDTAAQSPFLLVARETVQFNRASDYSLDLADLTALLAACDRHRHRRIETCNACAARLKQATDLYRGNFLEGFSLSGSPEFEEWALLWRERLGQQALDALGRLADYAERRGVLDLARRVLARQIELEAWHEEAHRRLMRVLDRSGQRTAALAQFEICRRALAEGLGVEPAAETRALYEQIKAKAHGPITAEAKTVLRDWPHPATPLFGRETEMAEVAELLANPDCRLLTLLGPGGIGKTRLAIAAAAEQAWTYKHGAVFVGLASLSSAEYLASAFAQALDLSFSGQADLREQLVGALREQEMLIVLDNFEHLLPAAHRRHEQADFANGLGLVTDLIASAPGVQFLVTSRERLNVQSEWLYTLHGLLYPDAGHPERRAEAFGAVQLFSHGTRRVRPGFELSDAEAPVIARICRMLGGLPLAIELAAAWTHVFSSTEIAAEIERSLAFLSSTLRDIPERHRSLRAVFDHSWKLLTPEEQMAFRSQSVFRGGFEGEAAETVGGATRLLLAALADKSLLRRESAGRYDMHEVMRQYADEKLREAGKVEETRERHLAYFAALAETAEPELIGAEQTAWLERLERDHDNIRSALEWAFQNGAIESAARLSASLWRFWYARGHLREGLKWLDAVLAQSVSVSKPARAKALHGAGVLTWSQSDYARATALFGESLALWQELGDKGGMARALNSLGVLASDQGDYARAQSFYEQSLALQRVLGDTAGVAAALTNLGLLALERGDKNQAHAPLEESLALYRELNDRSGIALALNNLGLLAMGQGNPAQARILLGESLALCREQADPWSVADVLNNLGSVALAQGNAGEARSSFQESLVLLKDLGVKSAVAACLEGLARVAVMQGQKVRAARLAGAAEAVRERIQVPRSPDERSAYAPAIAKMRDQLDQANFAKAWAEGQALSIEQMIELALQAP